MNDCMVNMMYIYLQMFMNEINYTECSLLVQLDILLFLSCFFSAVSFPVQMSTL